MRSRILFISGRSEDARELTRMLLDLPVALHHAKSVRHARKMLTQYSYSVILTDSSLPDGTWLDVLRLGRDDSSDLRVIVTDPQADARFWAEALNLGAYDLLAQPFQGAEVRRILSNACSRPTARESVLAAV